MVPDGFATLRLQPRPAAASDARAIFDGDSRKHRRHGGPSRRLSRDAARHRVGSGCVLARPHWDRGLMTGSLRAAVNRALATPGVFRVGAVCEVDDPASAPAMEKAGLSREGLLRRWMSHPNGSDEPRDWFIYGRTP